MPAPVYYPPARGRLVGVPVRMVEKFGRFESTGGLVTLGDADAEIITFSGVPDMIRLSAHANGALVTLTDRLGREEDEMHVHEGAVVDCRLGRDRVIARNASVGVNCQLSVEAFWADPAESLHAREPFRA